LCIAGRPRSRSGHLGFAATIPDNPNSLSLFPANGNWGKFDSGVANMLKRGAFQALRRITSGIPGPSLYFNMAEVDGEPTSLERGFEEFASALPRLIEECRYFRPEPSKANQASG
jgi:hypothetical protein